MEQAMTEFQRLVWIDWLDSASVDAWARPEEIPNRSIKVRTVGWVIHEDDDAITVGASIAESSLSGSITIPQFSIETIWDIEIK